MLRPFRVLFPANIAEASAELRRLGDRAKVYAGGAELVLLMRMGLTRADYLVDIKRIPELGAIRWNDGTVTIGATVTHHRIEIDPRMRHQLPLFAHAESQIGNIRIRNQGTLGGNLCFNDPHADPGTALLVYEATVRLGSAQGERTLPVDAFLRGPYETALEPDEVMTAVHVPALPREWGQAYLRIERLHRPTANVAIAARLDDGSLADVRLAVGSVGPRPLRLTELEGKLRGLSGSEARRVIGESRQSLSERLQPSDDLLGSSEYKIYIAAVLLRRGLEEALTRAGGGG